MPPFILLFAGLAFAETLAKPPPERPAALVNPDFEDGAPGDPPPGWTVPSKLIEEGYSAAITERDPASGAQSAELRGDGGAFGNLMQTIDAAPYRGQRVRVTAQIRARGGRGQLWVRVDRPDGLPGFFDNSNDRPVTEDEWTRAEIVGEVAADAELINVGLLSQDGARVRIDAVELEAIGPAGEGDLPPAPLSEEGLENVAALARLAGLVEYFHPTDAARDADWVRLVADAAIAAEPAESPEALAEILRAHFAPIAPAVQIWAGAPADAPAAVEPGARELVGVEHTGIGEPWQGAGGGVSIYRSQTVTRAARKIGPDQGPVVVALGGGVSARVPIWVAAGTDGPAPPEGIARPDGWSPSAGDRASRLAAVIRTWNVFQHFYPYWDVVEADWPAALRVALAQAAEAPDLAGLHAALERLVARAQDGHGRVYAGGSGRALPVELGWVGGEVVVIRPLEGGEVLAPGDALLAFDHRPIDQEIAALSERISSATDGWMRARLIEELLDTDEPEIHLRVRGADGAERDVAVATRPLREVYAERGGGVPEQGAELADGIFYFDLNGADTETLEPLLDQFAQARGLIFDLRGYPGSAGSDLLHHLTDERLRSALWNTPLYTRPDQEGVTFGTGGRWRLRPANPRLPENVVFVTGGGAISYAESCMGIVEHYDLAEIVGEPTAGTNGNINFFRPLPGVTVIWTGMKVLKHDGSQHHGIGILPTVPAAPTLEGLAAGRDEVLERAIQVAEEGAVSSTSPPAL